MAKKREKSEDAKKIEKTKTSKKDDFMLSDEELDKVAGGIAGAINVTTVQATIRNIGGTVMEPVGSPNPSAPQPSPKMPSGGY